MNDLKIINDSSKSNSTTRIFGETSSNFNGHNYQSISKDKIKQEGWNNLLKLQKFCTESSLNEEVVQEIEKTATTLSEFKNQCRCEAEIEDRFLKVSELRQKKEELIKKYGNSIFTNGLYK